jgi:hypothetical protein
MDRKHRVTVLWVLHEGIMDEADLLNERKARQSAGAPGWCEQQPCVRFRVIAH